MTRIASTEGIASDNARLESHTVNALISSNRSRNLSNSNNASPTAIFTDGNLHRLLPRHIGIMRSQ